MVQWINYGIATTVTANDSNVKLYSQYQNGSVLFNAVAAIDLSRPRGKHYFELLNADDGSK